MLKFFNNLRIINLLRSIKIILVQGKQIATVNSFQQFLKILIILTLLKSMANL